MCHCDCNLPSLQTKYNRGCVRVVLYTQHIVQVNYNKTERYSGLQHGETLCFFSEIQRLTLANEYHLQETLGAQRRTLHVGRLM